MKKYTFYWLDGSTDCTLGEDPWDALAKIGAPKNALLFLKEYKEEEL